MRINELYSWLIDNRNEIDSLWVQLANSYFYYSKISANADSNKLKNIQTIAKENKIDIPSERTLNSLELLTTVNADPMNYEKIDNLIKVCTNETLTSKSF